jgi:hypothetical protein
MGIYVLPRLGRGDGAIAAQQHAMASIDVSLGPFD